MRMRDRLERLETALAASTSSKAEHADMGAAVRSLLASVCGDMERLRQAAHATGTRLDDDALLMRTMVALDEKT